MEVHQARRRLRNSHKVLVESTVSTFGGSYLSILSIDLIYRSYLSILSIDLIYRSYLSILSISRVAIQKWNYLLICISRRLELNSEFEVKLTVVGESCRWNICSQEVVENLFANYNNNWNCQWHVENRLRWVCTKKIIFGWKMECGSRD
jgi:hypothetical protein